MNGFLNLYKPKGITSAHILNAVKKSLKGVPVGHMGTLDPLASGVLPVAIGKSTRLFDYLLDKDKVYIATFEFGYQTTTLDLEGETEFTSTYIPNLNEVLNALKKLTGEIMQIPPIYSAKCVGGKKGYKLARQGKQFELPPKKVLVNSIELLEVLSEKSYKIKISCKGGTYIRSICRDIGLICNSRATMTSLIREKSGIFSIENSVSAEDFVLSENKESFIIPPEIVVNYPEIRLTEEETTRLYNGLYDFFDYKDGIYSVFSPTEFYGVGEIKDNKLKVKAYIRDDK